MKLGDKKTETWGWGRQKHWTVVRCHDCKAPTWAADGGAGKPICDPCFAKHLQRFDDWQRGVQR